MYSFLTKNFIVKEPIACVNTCLCLLVNQFEELKLLALKAVLII